MNQTMNMLMQQDKPETIESLNDTVNEIGKLALKLGEYMGKTIGQRQDEALERDTERYLQCEKCSECGGQGWIIDEQDDGNKTVYRKITCPNCGKEREGK